jgi:hypothetical protein
VTRRALYGARSDAIDPPLPPTLAMNSMPTPPRTSTTRRCWSCAGWSVVLAPAVTAVTRFAVGIPYTLVTGITGLIGAQLAPPAFDEYKAGTASEWSLWMKGLAPWWLP